MRFKAFKIVINAIVWVDIARFRSLGNIAEVASGNYCHLKAARKSTGQNVILNYHLARTHEDKKYNTKPLEPI